MLFPTKLWCGQSAVRYTKLVGALGALGYSLVIACTLRIYMCALYWHIQTYANGLLLFFFPFQASNGDIPFTAFVGLRFLRYTTVVRASA